MSIDLKKSYGDTHQIPDEGLYVCRFLDNVSIINLVNFVHKFDIARFTTEEANDLHCTIMYSKDERPYERVMPILDPVKAHLVRFEHWPGHNGDGYLVAMLESEGLQRVHKFWRAMGCEHSFPEYTPHITLKHPCSAMSYDPQATVRAMDALAKKPLALRLLRESLYPIKKDDE